MLFREATAVAITTTDSDVEITPGSGFFMLFVSGEATGSGGSVILTCKLRYGGASESAPFSLPLSGSDARSFSSSWGRFMTAGSPAALRCQTNVGTATLDRVTITAVNATNIAQVSS